MSPTPMLGRVASVRIGITWSWLISLAVIGETKAMVARSAQRGCLESPIQDVSKWSQGKPRHALSAGPDAPLLLV
jgi:hypothetical protein